MTNADDIKQQILAAGESLNGQTPTLTAKQVADQASARLAIAQRAATKSVAEFIKSTERLRRLLEKYTGDKT